jgi:hypothetical protein
MKDSLVKDEYPSSGKCVHVGSSLVMHYFYLKLIKAFGLL